MWIGRLNSPLSCCDLSGLSDAHRFKVGGCTFLQRSLVTQCIEAVDLLRASLNRFQGSNLTIVSQWSRMGLVFGTNDNTTIYRFLFCAPPFWLCMKGTCNEFALIKCLISLSECKIILRTVHYVWCIAFAFSSKHKKTPNLYTALQTCLVIITL